MKGDHFIFEQTGNPMVYPGHPLVIACAIMHVFPNFDAAMKKSRDAYSAALSSHEIPGGDDHVGMAISLLKAGHIGRTADELIAQADAYWIDGNAGGHKDAVEVGLAQSAALIEVFPLSIDSLLL